MKKNVLVLALSLTCAAAFAPLAANAQIGINTAINHAPPPPRYEAVPHARPGQVWAPGYWTWAGRQYVWVSGHWERARSGYRYDKSQWVQGPHGWEFRQGGWQPLAPAQPPRAMMPPMHSQY